VIVLIPSAISVPVTAVELATFIARSNPRGARVRRPGPIPVMPVVAAADWIPVAVHPIIIWPWCHRPDAHHARPRWRSDPHTHRHLAAESRRCSK
jgi:hypothetical protein